MGHYAATPGVDLAYRDWIARIEARPACQAATPTAKALFKADLAAQSSVVRRNAAVSLGDSPSVLPPKC